MPVKAVMAVGLLSSACVELSPEEVQTLAAMELTDAELPDAPTNAVADHVDAVQFGRAVFFDRGLSSDGDVGCVSCHDPERGWSDPRPVSQGVMGREGTRHSMPITAAAHQTFVLWDGRADSLWSQALKAIENPDEMDFSRVEVAHYVASHYAPEYERVFGPLPSLEGLPPRATLGDPAWASLTETQQHDVNRVFSNVGKALHAYQRQISCTDTRFDRWVRGEVELSAKEEVGAANFLREGCVTCHSGPTFSDGEFHNIGIGSNTAQPDRGRAQGVESLMADPFNGVGRYSDDLEAGAAQLDVALAEERPLGAFRTPSLRGVGQREFFGHRGHRRTLREFLDDVYDDPHMQANAVGQLDDQVRGVEVERARAMVAFLHTLDCPAVAAEHLAP